MILFNIIYYFFLNFFNFLFTFKYTLPIKESDIEVFKELYNELRYLKRINDKPTEYISEIVNCIYDNYTECKKKFNVIPLKKIYH